MGVAYGREKFFSSLRHAVSSTVNPQGRLEGVAYGVCHLQRDSFPDDKTWTRFQKLMEATSFRPATGTEGTIQASTPPMTAEQAGQWLREAFGIFSEIAEADGAQRSQIDIRTRK